jgi:Group II intron, maturase-specific domain
MQHARDRVRELTAYERLLLPVEQVVQELNRYLRGWAGYFRYGNSARHFNRIEYQAVDRLVLFVAQRHQRPRAYGRWAVLYRAPGAWA